MKSIKVFFGNVGRGIARYSSEHGDSKDDPRDYRAGKATRVSRATEKKLLDAITDGICGGAEAEKERRGEGGGLVEGEGVVCVEEIRNVRLGGQNDR